MLSEAQRSRNIWPGTWAGPHSQPDSSATSRFYRDSGRNDRMCWHRGRGRGIIHIRISLGEKSLMAKMNIVGWGLPHQF